MGTKPLVFVIIILLFSFWSCLTFTPRGALDFPYSFRDNVADSFRLPQTWSSRGNGLGEPTISILWGWPHDFIYGLGATLGIDFSILFRLLHLLPILVLGVWGMIGLLYYYKINKYGIIVGTLFYFLNTYLILLIDGGQLSLALAYACVPLVFLEFKKSVSGKLRDKLITTLLFFLLGVFDIRFVYLLFILIFLDFTYWLILIPIKTKKPRVRYSLTVCENSLPSNLACPKPRRT